MGDRVKRHLLYIPGTKLHIEAKKSSEKFSHKFIVTHTGRQQSVTRISVRNTQKMEIEFEKIVPIKKK